ncbi:uncharacterized protein LOC135500965 [Lineus longissimus]|uniref:uncharacterized protein LOC135500965 n=1 Tax=Lineus longissimus TaxID=88925 RepID=UPI00315CF82C
MLTITVKRTEFKQKSRASVEDPHLPSLPGVLQFKNLHNHELISDDSLRERDVPNEAKQMLLELFQSGRSPSSALEALEIDLEFSEGDNYVFAAADRAQLPDAGYCYRLYYQIFKKAFGAPSGEQMLKDLEKHDEEYNCRNDKEFFKFKDTYDRRHAWAVSLREELPIRGDNTNNYVEAAMRILKDKVFNGVKAFNVVQLLDFMLTRFEAYYVR